LKSNWKLFQNKDFGFSSRMVKNSTGGITVIFRGFNFSPDAEIKLKDYFGMASKGMWSK